MQTTQRRYLDTCFKPGCHQRLLAAFRGTVCLLKIGNQIGTLPGIGRDPEALARISRASELNIVMGAGYYVPLVQWSKGEYLSANNQEDDLAIITTQNGFGYRADDHASNQLSATKIAWPWFVLIGTSVTVITGILSSFTHSEPNKT